MKNNKKNATRTKIMSMKDIESANTMKANVTRASVYTIHEYTRTNTSNSFQRNQQEQARVADKYERAHTQSVL